MGYKLRQLRSAAAWRESERRAIAVGIVGFFVFGVLKSFGVPILRQPAQAALLGMVAGFFSELVLSVAYYFNCLAKGILGLTLFLFILVTGNVIWLQYTSRSSVAPVAIISIIGYVVLHSIYIKTSGQRAKDFLAELTDVDESESEFKSQWAAIAFWAAIIVGLVAIASVLIR